MSTVVHLDGTITAAMPPAVLLFRTLLVCLVRMAVHRRTGCANILVYS